MYNTLFRMKSLLGIVSIAVFAYCIPITSTSAQSVGISLNLHRGPVRSVVSYSSERDGDWRTNYRDWQPTTMYIVDGQYYDEPSRGSREVVVYRHNDNYFLPPQDRNWVGMDRRYNYKRQPRKEDYNRKRIEDNNRRRHP